MFRTKQRSLRTTFTLIFIAIIASLLLSLYLLNRFFLESYYESVKVNKIEIAYETLDKTLELAAKNDQTIFDVFLDENSTDSDERPAVRILRTLNERSNIDIVIMSDDKKRCVSMSRDAQWQAMKLEMYQSLYGEDEFISDSAQTPIGRSTAEPSAAPETDESPTGFGWNLQLPNLFSSRSAQAQIPEILSQTQDLKLLRTSDRYMIQSIYDYRTASNYIECWGTFRDGKTAFLMSMPLSSIREGVFVTTHFMFLSGLILLVIGSFIVYFTAGKLTRPINNLAQLSDAMCKLDFSRKYVGREKNEIGVLGNSMNSMSDKLETAINELKEANSRLQKDIDEKVMIDDIRKEFIANVSHELKTPIALISGYAEGLTEGLAEDPESRDYYCGVILDEAVKMNKMVSQLTSLINYEFGKDVLEPSSFDLVDLIRSVTGSLEVKLEEKQADLQLKLPEAAPVEADEFKIEEVYTNYLNNALNHLDGARKILVTLTDLGDAYRVTVFNNGEPIPEASLPHVWEKFYKVDKARTRAYGGSGIGLSIVKAILEAHGGSYDVQNLSDGVEFSFCIKKVLTRG